jgi:hypothetical protein
MSLSKYIPRLLCKRKVHYRVHKIPQPVSILSQMNPLHTFHPISARYSPTSFHLRLGFPSGLFPSSFQLSHACCMPRPSHPPWFHHLNNICWSVQVMKLLIMQSSPAPCHFSPLVQTFSSAPCSQTPSVYVLPLVWETNFQVVNLFVNVIAIRYYRSQIFEVCYSF